MPYCELCLLSIVVFVCYIVCSSLFSPLAVLSNIDSLEGFICLFVGWFFCHCYLDVTWNFELVKLI